MTAPSKPFRTRSFFGRRKSYTLSARQENLLKNFLPDLAINLPDNGGESLHPATLFDQNKSACWLEIGFGKGEHLAWQAGRHPEVGFIGCEPYVNGVVGLLSRIEVQALSNIRIYAEEAGPLLTRLARRCLDRVFLLHPDPWPKRRHRGRRFVCQSNLDRLGRVMAPGAELRIGTDSSQYVSWTKAHMAKRSNFVLLAETAAAGGRSGDFDDWPPTRYETKAKGQGRAVIRLIYQRT